MERQDHPVDFPGKRVGYVSRPDQGQLLHAWQKRAQDAEGRVEAQDAIIDAQAATIDRKDDYLNQAGEIIADLEARLVEEEQRNSILSNVLTIEQAMGDDYEKQMKLAQAALSTERTRELSLVEWASGIGRVRIVRRMVGYFQSAFLQVNHAIPQPKGLGRAKLMNGICVIGTSLFDAATTYANMWGYGLKQNR